MHSHDEAIIDAMAWRDGQIEKFPSSIAADEEDATERPEFEIASQMQTAFERLIEILISSHCLDTEGGVLAAGRRVACLAWILGKAESVAFHWPRLAAGSESPAPDSPASFA